MTFSLAEGRSFRETSQVGKTRTRCSCRSIEHANREAVKRGLKIIRVRFSLPKGELPDLEVAELGKYLSYLLLSGRPRPSILFPRSQAGWDEDGIPRLLRLGRRARWEFSASVASLKRGLTQDVCSKHRPSSGFEKWRSRACQEDPPKSSSEYLRFVESETRRIFQIGWDRSYESFCESFVPKPSARFGGIRSGSSWWSEHRGRSEFLRGSLHGKFDAIEGFKLMYAEVPSVGKVRPLGIPSVDYDILGPLHKTMYGFLSGKPWLLSGPPSSKRMGTVCTQPWQTSVDLVSATDGLRLDVVDKILDIAFAKSRSIPGQIKCLAHESIRPIACSQKGERRGEYSFVSFGQMMGTYLSFPLLCIQSYLAARWATRHLSGCNYLVNGDDTVISASEPVEAWRYPDGFALNESKTMRQRNCVELNSTQFLQEGQGKWREVKGIRRAAWYNSPEGVLHVAKAALKAGPKWQSALASVLGRQKKYKPSELGLELWLPLVNKLENRMRYGTHLSMVIPDAPMSRHERYAEEPTWGDKIAFWCDLWEAGRGGLDRELRSKPSAVEVTTFRKKWSGGNLTGVTIKERLLWRKREGEKPKERKWCYSSIYNRVDSAFEYLQTKETEEGIFLVPTTRWFA